MKAIVNGVTVEGTAEELKEFLSLPVQTTPKTTVKMPVETDRDDAGYFRPISCEVCGKTFTPTLYSRNGIVKKRTTCSTECGKRLGGIKGGLTVKENWKNKTKPKKKKKFKAKHSGHRAECPQCKRIFRLTYAQIRNGKRNPDQIHYCSSTCSGKARAAALTPEELKFRAEYMKMCREEKMAKNEPAGFIGELRLCPTCGKEFRLTYSQTRNKHNEAHYCSRQCAGVANGYKGIKGTAGEACLS